MKIRINSHVTLMGETGCGETPLIKFFGTCCECAVDLVDVHAGFGRHEIHQVAKDCNERLSKDKEKILENDNKLPCAGRALNIALELCYYFRLDDNGRKMYNDVMYQRNKCIFSELLDSEIKNVSESFEIPAQVALHNNLKKKLFILFFCVFHQKLKDNQFNFNVKLLQCISFQGTRNCKLSDIKELCDQTIRR
ncbi:hypothetical protein RFI_32240 [Reticulomyxa filosa]|uniref:Uncharacterized protein n=1 Tax=Reticulomyxa filosa TaxID=46433 RepID=X6LU30_RETFI|nr:hypothetical protein RFI_32240 [Reticulomyxa filosa]|eukprot:ETO05159.1 hypothetical protein RFI_32240 [Reticulomyxa filosa]